MRFSTFAITMPDWEPEEAARNLKDIGYDGVAWRIGDQDQSDIPSFWIGNRNTWSRTNLKESVAEMKRIRDVTGLEISALYGYARWCDKEDVDAHLRASAELGGPVCRFCGSGPATNTAPRPQLGTASYDELLEESRRDWAWIADRAREYGVKAVTPLHNEWINASASSARRMLDGLDPERVGIIVDVGHLAREGWEDPLASLQILGPYLDSAMLKNYSVIPMRKRSDGTVVWGAVQTTMREGRVDIPNFIAALNTIGFNGWVSLAETEGDMSTRDRLADALAYCKAADEASKNAKFSEWVYDYLPSGGEWSGLPAGENLPASR